MGLIERLREAADDPVQAMAANEIERLQTILYAPISEAERKAIDKHCDWIAFGHAWNAVMKMRKAEHQ